MRAFKQVDVFTAVPYFGNALAVVLDGTGLSTEAMQRFAHWTNLSETTFLLPPTNPAANYRVRIFTPDVELPFAGHPTIGSCHAWLEAGGIPQREGLVVQECGAGLITLRRQDGRLAFAAPPLIRGGAVDEADIERTCRILRIDRSDVVDIAWADNGPGWIAVLLADAAAVLAIEPDYGDETQVYLGVAGPHPAGSPEALEVRAFFRETAQAAEDPVTGSLNASLAQWLLASGRIEAPYVAAQGTVVGRGGRVFIDQDGDDVWVGGNAVTCINGDVLIG